MDAARLTQWTRSVFPADLPDFDWSRLDLAGTIPNEKRLIIRLAIGTALLIAALFLPAGKVLYGLCLILSILITGYDYALAAAASIQAKKPFTTSVFITLALIFALIAGDYVVAAAFLILYRIYTIFVGFVTEHTVRSLWDALGESPKFQTACDLPKWIRWIAPLGLIASLVVFIIQLWVAEVAPVIAARNALSVLVIANPYSLYASAALTWLCALCGAYRFRILFRGSNAMQKLLTMDEMRDARAGLTFQGSGRMITPLGAKLIHIPGADSGKLIGLDRRCALEMVQSGEVLLDSDRLIDRQLERAAVSCVAGFAKLFPDSAKVLTY